MELIPLGILGLLTGLYGTRFIMDKIEAKRPAQQVSAHDWLYN